MTHVIRNDINYGDLVLVSIEDTSALTYRFYAEVMQLPLTDPDPVPDFITEVKVDVEIGTSGRKYTFYALSNDDIAPLAAKLSALALQDATVYASARILARYRAGSLVGAKKTLRDFYDNITDAELEATRF